MKFSDFSFHPDLQRGIEAIGFEECMPVQDGTFKHLQAGLDVYAQSQTGTGKTAAFLIGGMQYLLDRNQTGEKFLVVAPTRELAVQIEQEACLIGKFLPFKVASFLGGVGYGEQKRAIEEGANILVGTPGRLLDLFRSGDMPLAKCRVVVVDEADRMFDMGFIDDLRQIIEATPPKEERLTMLFSATLNSRVGSLSWEYMRETGEVIIEPEKVTVAGVSQRLYHLSRDEKVPLLLGLLSKEEPKSTLIFVNTKDEAYQLTRRLEHNGLHVRLLMGNIPQRDRLRVFTQLRNGDLSLVVATDVAARGLHIDGLDMVVNYDLPDIAENYVHRIGRTARAGKTGRVISFACETFVRNLAPIERFIGYKIPVEWVDDDLVAEDKSDGLKFARPGRTIARQNPRRPNEPRSGSRREPQHGRRPNASRAAKPTGPRPTKPTSPRTARTTSPRRQDATQSHRAQPANAGNRLATKTKEPQRPGTGKLPPRSPSAGRNRGRAHARPKPQPANRPAAESTSKRPATSPRATPPPRPARGTTVSAALLLEQARAKKQRSLWQKLAGAFKRR